MSSNPIISIIVPVYNVEHYLPKCIESILNQSFADFEVWLIDDGVLITVERFVMNMHVRMPVFVWFISRMEG